VFFRQGKTTIILDRDAFDYAYGGTRGPDPAQRDLDALLPAVTRVCVLEGATLRGRAMGGRVLLDTRDTGAIRDLAGCLRIVENPSAFGHCQCLGGPTIELYSGPEHVATIGVQHGRALRWKRWYHDAQLRDGNRLNRWLYDHGVDQDELAEIYKRGNNFLFGESPRRSQRQQQAFQLLSQSQERAREGSLAEALTLCTRALALAPDEPEAYALRGEILYHLGRLAEASADCSAAIDRGVRNPETHYIRAIALDQDGRMEDAAAECSMVLHLNPEHPGAYNSRGLIRGRLGHFDEALADLGEAMRLAPEWFLPYMNRGQVYHSHAQLEPALGDYDRAIELAGAAPREEAASGEGNPTLAGLYCRRGDARYDLFREEEAEADFAEAARRHPSSAAYYLGEMWMRRGKHDRALEAYSEAVRLNPEDAQAHVCRGTATEALGDLEQAAADYSTAIRLQPDEGPGYALRAQVRHRQGRMDDALVDLSEHLRIYPDDARAYHFRSHLHKGRQAWAAALEDFNSAHRVAPDDVLACNGLAWMLATCQEPELRDGARAVELARRVCEATDWEQPNFLDTFAAALAETGAFDEAVRWQSEAVGRFPEEDRPVRQARLELYLAGQPYRE
jgi:serine/threonine-protein kinase